MAKNIVLNAPYLFDGKIALALSGGRDSMVLAHALKRAGVDFFAVNFEHGIRGAKSVEDSAFVSKWCFDNGVECVSIAFDTPTYSRENGLTIEQGARELRYFHLDKLVEEGKCKRVAIAHHGDDQVETIFMRVLRGTGVRGLKGMSEVSGHYVRPLINYTREDIDAYVNDNHVPYVEDNTNLDDTYTRNYIRKEIAELKTRFPALVDAVQRLSRSACEVDDYLLKQVGEVKVDSEGEIDLSDLENPAVAKRKILLIAEKLGVMQDIEERHYPLIFDLKNAENGKRIDLPHGLIAHKDGQKIVLIRSLSPDDMGEIPFEKKSIDGIITVVPVDKFELGQGELIIDLNKVPKNAVLRHPRERDVIRKFGGGSKSLGDFLTDKKVPLRKRSDLIVLASAPSGYKNSNEILFVLGVEISKDLKVEDGANMAKITK
jgi:tRNA(Ile)-lysidine synthase